MIRIGERSWEAVDIQSRLKYFYQDDSIVDGYFGENTLLAVRAFQMERNLEPDGIVGPLTRFKLNKATKDALLYLFLHCSASPEGRDLDGQWIADYHMVNRGWSRPGYSDVIKLNGSIDNIREYNHNRKVEGKEYSWGVKGSMINRASRHICYIGGVDKLKRAKDTRTAEQKATLEAYVKTQIAYNPSIIIAGHNQIQKKACPSFDVVKWGEEIGIKKHNLAHWAGNAKTF